MGMHMFITVVLCLVVMQLKLSPNRIPRGARIVAYLSQTLLCTGLQKAVRCALHTSYSVVKRETLDGPYRVVPIAWRHERMIWPECRRTVGDPSLVEADLTSEAW